MSDGIHSTGRGGAGNIGPDPNVYADAGIVREGVAGESIDGAYSAGRGGAGNVSTPRQGAVERRRSQDFVPEMNLRGEQHGDFHTGRGGGGNVHKEKYGGHSTPQGTEHKESIIDKVKDLIHGEKEKKAEHR